MSYWFGGVSHHYLYKQYLDIIIDKYPYHVVCLNIHNFPEMNSSAVSLGLLMYDIVSIH